MKSKTYSKFLALTPKGRWGCLSRGWIKQQYDPADINLPAQIEWKIDEDEYSVYHRWDEHWKGSGGQELSMSMGARFSEDSPGTPVGISVWMCVYPEEFSAGSPIAEDQ